MGSPQAAQQAGAGVGVEQRHLKGVLGGGVDRILRIAIALQVQAADGEAQEARSVEPSTKAWPTWVWPALVGLDSDKVAV